MNCRDDLLSLWGVCAVLFFAAICILHFLFCDRKMNVFSPQVLATWRLYLFAVKVPTKVNVPLLSVEFLWLSLAGLDLMVIHKRRDKKYHIFREGEKR